MASERDELYNERLKQRREREAQRKKEQRALLIRLAMAAVAVILVAVLIVSVNRNAQQGQDSTIQTPPETTQTPEDPTTGSTDPEQAGEQSQSSGTTVIHIAAAGDLNVTDTTIQSNFNGTTYDFTDAFLDVAPVLASADLTVLNFEGILAGAPYGSQYSSAPLQLAQALADIGVDVVQTANSASIRDGLAGLQATLTALENAGIAPVGTFADGDAFDRSGGYTMVEVRGIRIAIVAFTKGMDNMGLPSGSEDCVNVLYTDYTEGYTKVDTNGITDILSDIQAEEPDLVIAMLHWGSENNEEISSSQKKIKDLLLANGVDIILGSHPHLVQTVDYDRENSTLVAYSLGDFYGDGTTAGTNYSLILDIEVTRDDVSGLTTITDVGYTPIYILQEGQSNAGGHRVVRIQQAIARYQENYIGCVTERAYSDMEYTLTRLASRTGLAQTGAMIDAD